MNKVFRVLFLLIFLPILGGCGNQKFYESKEYNKFRKEEFVILPSTNTVTSMNVLCTGSDKLIYVEKEPNGEITNSFINTIYVYEYDTQISKKIHLEEQVPTDKINFGYIGEDGRITLQYEREEV